MREAVFTAGASFGGIGEPGFDLVLAAVEILAGKRQRCSRCSDAALKASGLRL